MKHIIQPNKLTALSLLIPSLFALLLLVILEHGFGYHPCTLCIYERWPYFITLLIAVALLLLEEKNTCLTYLAVAVLFSGTGITMYHIGVEMHVFTVEESCAIVYHDIFSVSELQEQLAKTEIVRCDSPQKLFGIYLTHLNLIYSLGSALVALFTYRKNANRSLN